MLISFALDLLQNGATPFYYAVKSGSSAVVQLLLSFDSTLRDEQVHCRRCDVCSIFPIRGLLYSCNTCPDFDLCSDCWDKYGHPHRMRRLTSFGDKSVVPVAPRMLAQQAIRDVATRQEFIDAVSNDKVISFAK